MEYGRPLAERFMERGRYSAAATHCTLRAAAAGRRAGEKSILNCFVVSVTYPLNYEPGLIYGHSVGEAKNQLCPELFFDIYSSFVGTYIYVYILRSVFHTNTNTRKKPLINFVFFIHRHFFISRASRSGVHVRTNKIHKWRD